MTDLADALAALVADTLAAADAWGATGATLLPTGPLADLPAAEPWPPRNVGPGATGGAAQRRPEPRVPLPTPTSPPGANRAGRGPLEIPPRLGHTSAPPARVAPPARPSTAGFGGEPTPRPAPAARSPGAPAAEPATATVSSSTLSSSTVSAEASAGLAGLFGGKWKTALRDRGVEIDGILAAEPACTLCGTPARVLRGAGRADAALAVLAAPPEGIRMDADGLGMLEKMLVHVLSLERADVWVIEANRCAIEAPGACRALVVRQLEVVGSRLILAMGAAGPVLGLPGPALGEWARWGSTEVLATYHTSELQRRPGEKRAALGHLTDLRHRL